MRRSCREHKVLFPLGVPPLSARCNQALSISLAGLLMFWAGTASAQKKVPGGAKVLLLSGGQREHHGYRDQVFYLSNLLEDTGRYQATIVEDAAILETTAMGKYDILVLMADRRDPEFKFSLDQQKALLDWVKAGHGFVTLHGGDNAPADWVPEFKQMMGGIYSHTGLPDGKAIQGTYTIKIVDRSHPVARGLDDFEIKDELYSNMQMLPDIKPIATIDYKDVTWPVAWTWTYGPGKVFHTSLGHRGFGPGKDDPLQNPKLSRLVLQGIDWVAEGVKKTSAK